MVDHIRFRKGIFKEIASISITKLTIMMLINVASYLVPLAFIYLLTEALYNERSEQVNILYFSFLLLIVVVSYLLNRLSLKVELALCESWCEKYKLVLASKYFHSTDDEVVKISSISFNLLLDNFAKGLLYYTTPIIMLIISIVLYAFLGYMAFYALLFMLLFLPLSIYLAKKSDDNYEKILMMSQERVLDFKRWFPYAPYKSQFSNNGLSTNLGIDILESKINREKRLRSLDTALRGVDGYIVGFGRLIPLVLLSIFGFSVSTLEEKDITIFLWLCIPILQLVLSLPSTYTAKKMVNRALSDLDSLVDKGIPHKCEDITQEDYMSWPIWSEKVGNLIPFIVGLDKNVIETILNKFRLIPELGDEVDDVLVYMVAMDGSNLSSGQLVRLKVMRGFLFSFIERRPFRLTASLDSLDSEVSLSIVDFVNEYNLSLSSSVSEKNYENSQKEIYN